VVEIVRKNTFKMLYKFIFTSRSVFTLCYWCNL